MEVPKLEVGEHEVVHLEMGQKAEVRLDALEGQFFEGTVVEIAQKANVKNPGTDAEVTTFPVTVALATRPPGVLPGMNAEVRITSATRRRRADRPHPGGDGAPRRRASRTPRWQVEQGTTQLTASPARRRRWPRWSS